ncbi:MAG: DUF997 domain-containing protein [Desulfobacteraceae bacterium]|nr:MAG: DUF997 domain-containing protein [Desulfobacteraceae bacterium]
MESTRKKKNNLIFLTLFLVLTVLCWCPVGYGSYGEVAMIFGMPSWAFFMLVFGAVLFVLEWIYLFWTDLALYDDDLETIMTELEALDEKELIKEEV